MKPIPDDFIVRSLERTGYVPWIEEDPDDEEYCNDYEPFAVYDPEW